MAGDIELFVCSRVSSLRGKEKPRVGRQRRDNAPNWPCKELERGVESGDGGIHPEKDSKAKSGRPWVSGLGANKNIQK